MAAVVFDFDHSFAEECADFWILEQLGRPGVESLVYMRDRLKADPLVWNKCMQEITDILFRAGVSRPAIEQAARRIPVFPHHVAVIQLAHQLRMSCHIVSDANEVWINECLAGTCWLCRESLHKTGNALPPSQRTASETCLPP